MPHADARLNHSHTVYSYFASSFGRVQLPLKPRGFFCKDWN